MQFFFSFYDNFLDQIICVQSFKALSVKNYSIPASIIKK